MHSNVKNESTRLEAEKVVRSTMVLPPSLNSTVKVEVITSEEITLVKPERRKIAYK